MKNWSKWHTLGVVLVSSLVLALGAVSTYVTFDEEVHWGLWSFVALVALLVSLLGVVGHGLVKKVDGSLIDNRFRMSLAQFQLIIWTVVVLGAWGAAVFANLGLSTNTDAFDVSIPSELWLALGISFTSLGGAKLIQKRDTTKHPVNIDPGTTPGLILAARDEPSGEWKRRGNLLAHASIDNASWGDLFAADDVNSGAVPDISKIQMFVFTIVLAFGYAVASADLLATHGSNSVTGLPPLNESFVILLGISQGAYLAKKGVDQLNI